MSVFKTLANINIREEHSFYEKRIRHFFQNYQLDWILCGSSSIYLENDRRHSWRIHQNSRSLLTYNA